MAVPDPRNRRDAAVVPAPADDRLAIPDTEALVCRRLDADLAGLAPDRLALAPLGEGAVRVRIHAAALNFPDLLMCAGGYQFKPPLPFAPGMEGAGEIEAVGPGVDAARVGERVSFGCRHGALARRIVLPVNDLQPWIEGFDAAEAAAWRVGALTAYVALVRRADLQPGETLLVHGATGGMGQAAVQLGRHLGATVIATGTGAARLQVAADLGAHHLIDLAQGGFRERVKSLTEGRGADVVFDPVGGDVFDESIRAIAWGGRLLVIGFASGRIGRVDANLPLIKGFSIVGVRAGEYGRRDPARGAQNLVEIERLARAGVLRPHIGARFPFERALEAMRTLAGRQVAGKVVVVTA